MYGSLYGPRRQAAFRRGIRSWLSPPLTITTDEMHEMVGRLDSALTEWESIVLQLLAGQFLIRGSGADAY